MYKSIGFRVQKYVEDFNLPLGIVHPFNNSKIPPWELIIPDVDISLSEFEKTTSLVFKQKLTEIKQSKPPAIEIYTDVSKDNKLLLLQMSITTYFLGGFLADYPHCHLFFFHFHLLYLKDWTIVNQ